MTCTSFFLSFFLRRNVGIVLRAGSVIKNSLIENWSSVPITPVTTFLDPIRSPGLSGHLHTCVYADTYRY
ncbi:CHK2 checkpoint homolog (S. pombe), isoform CRA_c [Rattus norvegicus]|uniref:CHK2 checkpoint homolog (S. pombe), isoform CRA_c n=1 Tax=Rattus norvegicus TaxID=10116 RepID=A6J284_RAT|nr:CHK2 checkpoint homolog (S. pombe), isoform CRA_c [Rattus norvegicus]